MSVMKENALYYASLGLAVFPLLPKDKKPATIHGCLDATTDVEQIKSWWKDNPNYNVGIATGKKSGGLVVIDVDMDSEKGKEGYESLKKWEREHGELPATWTSITGSGGYHFLYRDSDEHRNAQGLYEDIDVRGEGGYIVAPPSIHPNGSIYEWELGPGDCSILQAEETVKSFLAGPIKREYNHFQVEECIPAGKRTSVLVALTGSLKAKGLGNDAIKAAVMAENKKKCVPPLSNKDLERTVFPALDRGWQTVKSYHTTVENGVIIPVEKKIPKTLDIISASDLQDLEIPPLEFVVENFLPLGLMLLGAPPKSYKSYMCLDMALSICQGLDFLGFKTQKHGVLYLDLESTKRRPKTRIEQILKGKKAPNNLYIATESEILGKGFEEQIESAIKEHPDIKVVIVDVFKKIRPAGTKNKDGYDRDYEDYGRVKSVSDKLGIVIVLVTHTTKMKCENDPFNELTGSSGTMGSIDVAMVIKKEKRDDETAKLYITGRDLQQQCYEMKFNQENFRWQMLGEHRDVEKLRKELEYKTSPIIKTIKKLIEQNNGKWTGTVSDIINASKYFDGCCIFDKPQQVGQKITAYEDLLHNMDCIDIHRISDGGKNRLLNFVSSNPFIDNLL